MGQNFFDIGLQKDKGGKSFWLTLVGEDIRCPPMSIAHAAQQVDVPQGIRSIRGDIFILWAIP